MKTGLLLLLGGLLGGLMILTSWRVYGDGKAYLGAAKAMEAEGVGEFFRAHPYADYPPGYPLLLAAGPLPPSAMAKAVNFAALVATFSLAAVALRRWQPPRRARFGLLALVLAPTFYFIAAAPYSDILFCALALATLLWPGQWQGWAACCGATLTRYLGITLWPIVAWTVWRRTGKLSRVALALAPSGLVWGLWAGRNLALSGRAFGERSPQPDGNFDRLLPALYWLALMALLVTLLSALFPDKRAPRVAPVAPIAFGAIYLAILGGLAAISTGMTPVDERTLAPVAAPLLIIGGSIGHRQFYLLPGVGDGTLRGLRGHGLLARRDRVRPGDRGAVRGVWRGRGERVPGEAGTGEDEA
jgi:hypothetical protein